MRVGDHVHGPSDGPPPPVTAPAAPSSRAIADAVGHCVMVFAFVPTLAAMPEWLLKEGTNALNLRDPLVLLFLPVRGLIVLLNTFFMGAAQGVIAGVCAGLAMVAWRALRGTPASTAARVLRGGVCGVIGATVMIAAILSWHALRGGPIALPAAAVAFELASGVACGMLAAPGVFGLLAAFDG